MFPENTTCGVHTQYHQKKTKKKILTFIRRDFIEVPVPAFALPAGLLLLEWGTLLAAVALRSKKERNSLNFGL